MPKPIFQRHERDLRVIISTSKITGLGCQTLSGPLPQGGSPAREAMTVGCKPTNLLSARSLLSHSIEDAARDGPCAHGNEQTRQIVPSQHTN